MNATLEKCLTKTLPFEVVDHVKLFTGNAYWKNGKLYNVTKIEKNDFRYAILKKMPKIKQVHNGYFEEPKRGCVWFKMENGKFATISVLYKRMGQIYAFFWEFQYNQTCVNQYIGQR
jgi:hypothetical protein